MGWSGEGRGVDECPRCVWYVVSQRVGVAGHFFVHTLHDKTTIRIIMYNQCNPHVAIRSESIDHTIPMALCVKGGRREGGFEMLLTMALSTMWTPCTAMSSFRSPKNTMTFSCKGCPSA